MNNDDVLKNSLTQTLILLLVSQWGFISPLLLYNFPKKILSVFFTPSSLLTNETTSLFLLCVWGKD